MIILQLVISRTNSFLYLRSQHAVQALQLIQLSIEHFLAPNLALLSDTLQGSGMEQLGPVIHKKLHDPAWEIRDSTLELLASISRLAKMSECVVVRGSPNTIIK